jgi:hypothetical protein
MLDSLTAWLSPAQRKATYAALGAIAAIIVVLGWTDESTVNGWVALIMSVLALLALVVAAIKAKSVDWKALYVLAAAAVAAVKGVGLLDDELETQVNKVLAAAIAAVPLIIAAVRTDTSVATGQPAQELANDVAQQQIASPPLPTPDPPAVAPDAFEDTAEPHLFTRVDDRGAISVTEACLIVIAVIAVVWLVMALT